MTAKLPPRRATAARKPMASNTRVPSPSKTNENNERKTDQKS